MLGVILAVILVIILMVMLYFGYRMHQCAQGHGGVLCGMWHAVL